MKNKIIVPPFLFLALFLTGAVSIFAANSTSTDVTEFLPNFDETSSSAQEDAQKAQVFERFRGMIPDALLNSLVKNPVTQTSLSTSTTDADLFTKNLKLGDTDVEVLLLQKSLNEDTDTVVSVSGPGSIGNETTYFGQLTKNAVIKLQNKHYGEVLAPNGLSSGTGYFGASTRAMMNNMRKSKSKTTSPSVESLISTIPNGPVSGLGEKVKITAISPTHGKTGTVVTIYGSGMTPTANKVIAGEKTFYNIPSYDGKTLSFVIESPLSLDFYPAFPAKEKAYIIEHFSQIIKASFPKFKAPICVMNDTGMSNCAFFTFDI